MTFTPKMLTDLAYFFTNTDRSALEQAGIINPGKSGDDKWKRYNHNFDIFILKSDEQQLTALAKLANGYVSSFSPPPQSHTMGGQAAAIVAEYDAFLAARQDYAPTARLVASDAIGGKALDLLRTIAEQPPETLVEARWRVVEAATGPGYWGIELEQAGNDDDMIMCPIKIHRDTVARIVEAHNAALAASATEDGR